MATSDDLNNVAELCANAADAATTKLIALGPRPNDPGSAATWDAQDTLLKNKISTLNNLSASASALIVSDALAAVWPTLNDLSGITSSAEADIEKIANISSAMAALASVINFAVSVVTVATQPTISNAGGLLTAFNNMAQTL
jgi:hypothetical protein